jgi:hypothetical protein
MINVLAAESPRNCYVPHDPIAAAGIIVNPDISDIDVLSPETGDGLISNGSAADVKGLLLRHAPVATISSTFRRPAVGWPESLIVALSTIELPIIDRSGTTVIARAGTTVIARAGTTPATLESA